MKKVIIPGFCFAVLSTAAFEQTVHATEIQQPADYVKEAIQNFLSTKYVSVDEGSRLNMRAGASTNSAIIAKLKRNTQVSVLSEANGWTKISVNGQEGFVSSQYLTTTSVKIAKPEFEAKTAAEAVAKYVNVEPGSRLNMRNQPFASASVIVKLARGKEVTVFSVQNGWAKIKAYGQEGYVSAQFLSLENPAIHNEIQTKPPQEVRKFVNVNPGSHLNIRSSASTSGTIVGRLPRNSEVAVIEEANGWAKITADGKEGYVSSQYLATSKAGTSASEAEEKPAATSAVKKYVNVDPGSHLNIRSSASTSGTIVGRLPRNSEVSVIEEANGWAKITADGKEGYVSNQYLAASKAGTSVPEAEEKPAATPAVKKYVNVDPGSSLNMRNQPSASASIIVKLARGIEVTVISEVNGWAKIEAYGQEGYVSTQFLAAENPGSQGTAQPDPAPDVRKYVNVDPDSHLNIRSSASTSGVIIGTLPRNSEVAVIAEANGWAKIIANGHEGYISTQYLSATSLEAGKEEAEDKPESPAVIKYVNVEPGSSLNMRNKPSTSASIIVKLARGKDVTVYSEANGWAKINAYGQEGYVSLEFLSTEKPGENSGSEEHSSSESPVVSKFVAVDTDSSLNMRAAASTDASIITKLTRGTIVSVLSEENGWAKISANGFTGYVNLQYLSPKNPDNPDNTGDVIDKTYQYFDITLEEMMQIQMAASPQTDKKYRAYIREDALIPDTITDPDSGIVTGNGWNVRGGAGTNYWVIGKINNGENVQIISKVKGEDGFDWYEITYSRTWVNASPEDVKYYLDPHKFENNSLASFQFLKLSQTTNLVNNEVNDRILSGKGILQGKAESFITAGKMYGVNEMYLITHALLETGNGTSRLANGVQVNGKTVYNMYGIGAYDKDPVGLGAQYAYNAGWFTPEAAIVGGAQFIANGYINSGQDTLYKMRWNPAAAIREGHAAHQYATDIGWATKQVNQIYNLYSLLDSHKIMLDILQYILIER
ncbi:SH3 domain-containing protein [Bacillaceae bacterium Marseille-Q3522]|nr:SH3 domain-containing protein [Bacillaceae bacterium Marseille-Q3522]